MSRAATAKKWARFCHSTRRISTIRRYASFTSAPTAACGRHFLVPCGGVRARPAVRERAGSGRRAQIGRHCSRPGGAPSREARSPIATRSSTVAASVHREVLPHNALARGCAGWAVRSGWRPVRVTMSAPGRSGTRARSVTGRAQRPHRLALLRFVASPEAAATIRKAGLTPP